MKKYQIKKKIKKKIMNGISLSNKIKKKIKKTVLLRKKNNLSIPGLAIIFIGNNKPSTIYIKNKKKACKKVGFFLKIFHIKKKIKENKILKIIYNLNKNKIFHGILIQLPLPKYLNKKTLINAISKKKDVDGFHSNNSIGSFCKKKYKNYFKSCTALGIMQLLKKYKINLTGLNALIIGDSNIVGKPISVELLFSGCTITIANKYTKNIIEHIKIAELIIIAIGKPNFLNGKWLKKGVIIIDVGINFFKNKIVGDVNFDDAYKKSLYITPVPGGVGPMTIAYLLKNTLKACIKFDK